MQKAASAVIIKIEYAGTSSWQTHVIHVVYMGLGFFKKIRP